MLLLAIYKQEVSYYSEDGEWLNGDSRLVQAYPDAEIRIDGWDVQEYGSDVAAAVNYLKNEDIDECSLSPIPTSVREHVWLSGRYTDHYTGNVTETSIYIRDCDDIKRAVIFRELTGASVLV